MYTFSPQVPSTGINSFPEWLLSEKDPLSGSPVCHLFSFFFWSPFSAQYHLLWSRCLCRASCHSSVFVFAVLSGCLLYSIPCLSAFCFSLPFQWVCGSQILLQFLLWIMATSCVEMNRQFWNSTKHSFKWGVSWWFMHGTVVAIHDFGSFSSQDSRFFWANLDIVVDSVWLYISSNPLGCGWHAVVRRCSIPNVFVNSSFRLFRNFLPWSVVMTFGSPTMKNSCKD